MLKDLIERYSLLEKRLREFYSVYKKQWFKDNKPYGFDIQDIRIGGLEKRISSCRQRLIDYTKNKISIIEELEEEILPYGRAECGIPINCNKYNTYASTSVISH